MCGIFGIISDGKSIGKMAQGINGFVEDACRVGSVRGSDSTGLFQVAKDGKRSEVYKLPYVGELFSMTSHAQRMFNSADSMSATIGHHRAATHGTVRHMNAHPFEHSGPNGRHVVGVHNGYVSTWNSGFDGKNFSVDSDYIYYRIMKEGAKEALSVARGAMALVWYEEDGKIRIFNNGQRTLYWGYVKGQNIMLLASEHPMLYWLAWRNGLELEEDLLDPENNFIYTIDPADVRDYDAEKVEEKKEAPAQRPLALGWDAMRKKHTESITPVMGAMGPTGSLDPPKGNMTFQGHMMKYLPEDLKAKFGINQGHVAEFLPFHPGIQPLQRCQQLLGDIHWLDEAGKKQKAAALMVSVNDGVRENIYRAFYSGPGSLIRVRCIATSTVTHNKKDFPVVVVMRPHELYFDPEAELLIKDDDLEEIVRDVPGPKGMMTEAAFVEATKDGCSQCTGHISVQDARKKVISWNPNSGGGFDWLCKICTAKNEENFSDDPSRIVV